MRRILAAVVGLGAIGIVGPQAGGAPASAEVCIPSETSSATAGSGSIGSMVSRQPAVVVRRSTAGVTARGTADASASADVVADGSATVVTCTDGVAATFTRAATRSGNASGDGSATLTETRPTAREAKRAAATAARRAAAHEAESRAWDKAKARAKAKAASAALDAARVAATGGPEQWSIGYYAGYEAGAYPVSAVDWSGMTHVAVSFYLPHADGSLGGKLYQGTVEEGTALADSLVEAAHAHGRKALASIGGAGKGDELRAAMTDHPAALVSSIVALRDQGYDGVDLDWEPLERGDQALLANLGTQIRQAWPEVELTVPLEPVNTNFPPGLGHLDEVAAVFDHLDLMTYGMAYTFDGWRSWHSSALTGEAPNTPTSVASTVQAYLDAGVPAEKLGVGIGAYGLCFSSPVTGPGQELGGAQILKEDYDLQFRDIRTHYEPVMSSHYSAAAEAPYLSGSERRCTYITYEDERSTAAKLAWAEQEGLGGVIMWTVNQQYLPGAAQANPLLATVGEEWLH